LTFDCRCPHPVARVQNDDKVDNMPGETVQEVAPHRAMITVCAIGATVLQLLDQTIANVALPYMQGSFSASFDEITWVLTSYITASAIATAPVGWLAARYGRKPLYVCSVLGFTVTSMLCGAAQSLEQIVVFRVLQGAFGAALAPLSQATLLDIYPPERRGFAMAILGVGIMLGPIMGPTVGGWLTETYNWRWVFYINLPFGLLAATGLMIYLPGSERLGGLRFDWLGFGMLAVAIGAMQLMLDRGQDQDWFASREIIVEAVFAGLGLYLVLVHFLAAPQPLIRPVLFKDVNFVSGVLLMFMVGIFMVSSLALMTPWLQVLSHYPVETAGIIMAPRGFGSLVTTMLSGRLSTRVDARVLVGIGLTLLTYTYWVMTGWTPDVSEREIIVTIIIQGAAMGFLWTPIQLMAFATLAPSMRTEGAALFSLLRNLGSAIGVSVAITLLARNTQAMHEIIGAAVTPFNRALQAAGPTHQWFDPAARHGAAVLDRIVNEQAQIVAYADDYVLLILATVPAWLLLLVVRLPRKAVSTPAE
jgi:DHA2 family multidrug resistance protein